MRRRADRALVAIVIGALALCSSLFAARAPFGFGALGAFLGLAIAAGASLSDSNRVRGDAFTGAGIVLSLIFVTLFITYPLMMVPVAHRHAEQGRQVAAAARAARRGWFRGLWARGFVFLDRTSSIGCDWQSPA